MGTGKVRFYHSKLVLMSFSLPAATSIQDVINDVSKELDGAEPSTSVETSQNGFGAKLQTRKAQWEMSNLNVVVSEMKSFEYGYMGITVVVADSDYLRQKERERQASRPNTIR